MATIFTDTEQNNKKYTVGQAIQAAQTLLGEKGYGREVVWEKSTAVPHLSSACNKAERITLEELNLLVEELVYRTAQSKGKDGFYIWGPKTQAPKDSTLSKAWGRGK